MIPPGDEAIRPGNPGSTTDTTRAGYVTLVGRPNVGKSTLLNSLVGSKLSIVTEKAQTTWQRVTGIATRHGAQMIFLDTPGLLDPRSMIQRSMLMAAQEAIAEADVVLLVVDTTHPPASDETRSIPSALESASAPLVVCLNKVDAARESSLDAWEAWALDTLEPTAVHRISALEGTGLEALEEELRAALPESPFLYPPEDIASQPVRFFVEELLRETVFEQFRDEVPYSALARIDEYRADQEPVYIGATVYVERNSQKGILVGKGGRAIRELGRVTRSKIEEFIGEPVYLDLWVKVLPGWRRKREELRRLGFPVPREEREVSRT